LSGHDEKTTALAIAYAEALGSADVERVLDLLTEDVEYEDAALGQTHRGHEEVRHFLADSVRTSGNRWLVDRVHATAEGFGMAWHIGGRHDRDLPGAEGTGEFFTIAGASMVSVRDGRIARVRDFWNALDLAKQLKLKAGVPH
jgi:steroid delta-isomerase-like uncharacterized protein